MIDRRALTLPIRLRVNAPGSDLPLCKLCDIADWENKEFRDLSGEIMDRTNPVSMQHRKLWEYTQATRAIARSGLLGPGRIGLSVAAGCERILFYLANFVGRVVATDIYGEGSFAGIEANIDFLREPERFAPYPYPHERLKPLYMDALHLAFRDSFFDFALCLSSLEHFGGRAKALRAIIEMKRVVNAGGLVILTTECALNGARTDEVFTPSDIDFLISRAGMDLLEPIDWSLSTRTLDYLLDMRCDDLGQLPHINLSTSGSIFTSMSLGDCQKIS